MKNTMRMDGSTRSSARMFASFALLASMATVGWSGNASAAQCLDAAYGGSTNCTANDISVASITVTNIVDGCTGDPADTFTFDGTLDVQPTATSRYDIGFYIGANPQLSVASDCAVAVIPPAITDLDGDQCGDTSGSTLVNVPVFGITAPCQDSNGDGFFDVNTCSSWKQTGKNDCTGPDQAVPGTASKCNCQVVQTTLVVPYCATNAECDDANVCTDDICNAYIRCGRVSASPGMVLARW